MTKEAFGYLMLIVIMLVAASILTIVLRRLISIFIRKYSSRLNSDPTNFSFLKNSVGFIVYTSAIIFIFIKIPYLNEVGTALFAGAGIVAVVVGLASQKAFANIISGIFILLFKPFRITDIIELVNGQKGVVEEITLRHTIIKDYENRRIIIPNSVISDETIINSNIQDEKIRKHVVFSVSYDTDLDKAMAIIADEAGKHPFLVDSRSKEEIAENAPKVVVRVIALSDFSIDIKAYLWARGNDNAFVMQCDLLKKVKERFDKEGIEIPFPYRTIVYKNDLSNEKDDSPKA